VYVCRTREERGWKLAVEHLPPPPSLHTTVQILEYIPFWSYFYIGARTFRVFFWLNHLLCTTPTPTPPGYVTGALKQVNIDRIGATVGRFQTPNRPPLPPPPKKNSFSGPVITKCDAVRHSAPYLRLQQAYRLPATLLDTNLYPGSGLALFAFTPCYRKNQRYKPTEKCEYKPKQD